MTLTPTCLWVIKLKPQMNYLLDQITDFFSFFLLTELALGIRKDLMKTRKRISDKQGTTEALPI